MRIITHLMACRRTTKRAFSSSSLIAKFMVIFMAACLLFSSSKLKHDVELVLYIAAIRPVLRQQRSGGLIRSKFFQIQSTI